MNKDTNMKDIIVIQTRHPDQLYWWFPTSGTSQQWYIVEIYRSGPEPSIYSHQHQNICQRLSKTVLPVDKDKAARDSLTCRASDMDCVAMRQWLNLARATDTSSYTLSETHTHTHQHQHLFKIADKQNVSKHSTVTKQIFFYGVCSLQLQTQHKVLLYSQSQTGKLHKPTCSVKRPSSTLIYIL